MKNVSKQKAFDDFASRYGPDWAQSGPYASNWAPYRDDWLRRNRR